MAQDFIPDEQFTPDPSSQAPLANQAQNQTAAPQQADFIPDESFQSDEDKYGTPTELAKTALEGVAEGVAGPIAPWAEQAVGVDAKDILLRSQTNPITHYGSQAVGLAGSMLTGIGEGALIAKAGEAATQGLKAGVLSSAARASVESALLQSGDEVSKMILKDPNQSVQTAVTNVGLSGLLGAGIGGAVGSISPLWKSAFGDKMSQTIADFKGRINERLATPDPATAVTEELGTHYSNVKSMADDVYGAQGLKAQDIAKAMPEMSPKISTQASEVGTKAQDLLNTMKAKPNTYPERLVSKLEDDVTTFNKAVSDPNAGPSEIFNATQDLKQAAQNYSKFDKFVKPVDEAYDFVKKSKDLAYDLRQSLEDSSVWGKAADRQKTINKAFVQFKPALEDFEKRFTTKVANIEEGGFDRVIDPGKVNTYMNQLGKASAEIKQSQLENFLTASDRYRKVISDTHTNLGMENPLETSSLQVTRGTLGDVTPGAKMADAFIKKGLEKAPGSLAGAGLGGAAGSVIGHGAIGAYLGEKTLGPLFNTILPGIAKSLLTQKVSGAGAKAAIDYAMAVNKGNVLVLNAAKSLFKDNKLAIAASQMPTASDRAKLDSQLKQAQADPTKLANIGSQTGHYLPDHNQAMGVTAASAVNYLNSIRPQSVKQSPMDKTLPVSSTAQADYNRALDLAQQPLLLLKHVQDGTVRISDIKAVAVMYPALYQKISQQVTDEAINHISKGHEVPYRLKIGLSMLAGQAMDSTMTQASIAAAQPMQQQSQLPSQQTPKKGTKSAPALQKMSNMYKTPEQSAEEDQAKR